MVFMNHIDLNYHRFRLGCGWLVVTCVKQSEDADDSMSKDPMSLAREDYAACCCAVQNLCLSLHSQGLGTKWTTGELLYKSHVI